ncbi:FAD-binding oxidoreductase [Mangrovactinospora gilvigrisea]|uniref:FAD-binding oxidoreductase n=1 Tax=Mangrovactinospora gilvigrisea TaxID=1428644 RepID=A0A1J7C503_9ACTN|nr:FAD-binding oxidoreductase [Mangrovactinospora gilvigrisea]
MPALEEVRRELAAALPAAALIDDHARLRTYECDGLTGYRVVPGLVALPGTHDEVVAAVRSCHRNGVPYVARGAGTGLSGGALPVANGIVIGLSRMRKILEVDTVNETATVEPGVTNLAISQAAAAHGLYYAPDPSSQQVCTIGGNVAENSGGAHCLKYGFTTHHVLAADVVLPDGTAARLGGDARARDDGPDLLGLFIGSEGTLGIATRITVRLLRRPAAVRTLLADFGSVEEAGRAVSGIVAAGIVPAAVEMMDALAMRAAEAATGAGFTLDPARAAAALVVEVDGPPAEVEECFRRIVAVCETNAATRVRVAADPEERARIWRGRKAAFAAMGRISPDYFVQDGVVPRARLAEVLARIAELGEAAGLRVANVFHAGDGNLHPLVLYDASAGQSEAGEELSRRIAELCVELGGSLSGEHGIGADKACSMPRMFSETDLAVMARVRDAVDRDGLCNPGKVLPTPRLCGERIGPYRAHVVEEAGLGERW